MPRCPQAGIAVALLDQLVRRKVFDAAQAEHVRVSAQSEQLKLLAYDAGGHFLYSWGTFGTCQGCQWGVHGFSTDKEGNLYTAEVRTGRVQKYAPRKGANPDFIVGKPWPGVW